MYNAVQFETPENVVVDYQIAGPGTRFVAWLTDVLLLVILGVVFFLITMFTFASIPDLGEALASAGRSAVLFGMMAVVGFAPILYFLLAEIFMDGQTPGKRSVSIRVVRAGGFGLTLSALFIRNIFRVLDTFPLLWVVPVLTAKGQRLGDMVADTLVVHDTSRAPNTLREQLLNRPQTEADYRFSPDTLRQLDDKDLRTVETFLNRRESMQPLEERDYRARILSILAARFGELPDIPPQKERQYLEDLMTAHYRRQFSELE